MFLITYKNSKLNDWRTNANVLYIQQLQRKQCKMDEIEKPCELKRERKKNGEKIENIIRWIT